MISVLLSAVLMSQVSAMCVPCQTCNDILPNGQKVDMVAGVFEYDWEFPCGTVYGTLSPDRKLITVSVPECCKVKVCRKAGTDCDTGEWLLCGQDKTYGVSNGKELSHVSIQAQACCVPPTPTPPPPTATPTPPGPTPTPTPCIPLEQCGSRCGTISDNCGGTIYCGVCPPTPTPTPKSPDPVCNPCTFPASLSIVTYKSPLLLHTEWFYFSKPKAVLQIVIDMGQYAEYIIYSGTKNPDDPNNRIIWRGTGTRTVTIPWPLAGLPIREFSYLGFKGGTGRMTIWLEDGSHVTAVSEELTAIAMP